MSRPKRQGEPVAQHLVREDYVAMAIERLESGSEGDRW